MSQEARADAEAFNTPALDALAVDETPLPRSPTTLPAPVHVVECSPSHLSLKTRWYAPFYVFFPVSILPFLALGIWLLVEVAQILDDPIKREVAGGILVGLAILGAGCIFVFLVFCWTFIRMYRGYGPFHFDRDADVVRFGPASKQQSRPMKSIAAVQLIPAPLEMVLAKELTDLDKNWLTRLLSGPLKWAGRRSFQINLAFSDGSRLNVTNWSGWTRKTPESMKVAAERLAEFLNVPVKGQNRA